MMQMDSGGGPFPNDGLHQLFRHYPAKIATGKILINFIFRFSMLVRRDSVQAARTFLKYKFKSGRVRSNILESLPVINRIA